uniref:Thioredoxin domain-containing protein n=1 Tax=viral metagenome TaxID=1070528 RepID=A0A6C0LWU3_9ZZZZ
MSGLLFLTSDDFQLQRGSNKGNIMCTSIPGFSLILFYSTQCIHCKTLIPIFKNLPGKVGGCQFGMINVSHNKKCVLMSRQTIAPIKVVPYIILYVNGKPYMRYKGPHDHREISRFIVEVSQSIQSNKKSNKTENNIVKDPNGGIPAYTIGKPLYGTEDDVCYLEFNNAYGKKQQDPKRVARSLPSASGMNR